MRGQQRNTKHVQHVSRKNKSGNIEELRAISAGIIMQAVEDWVTLIKAEEKMRTALESGDERAIRLARNYRTSQLEGADISDIRSFFRSEFGIMLCENIDIEPLIITKKLESWLMDYRKHGKVPKINTPRPRAKAR